MTTDSIDSIKDICDLVVARFHDWKQFGEVYEATDGDLVLLNYTNAAQYERRWNFFERVSRGLIISRVTGEVVARPFDKFFNWGEFTTDSPLIEATEKMDGSLGILYGTHDGYRIATRGSFHSEQAEWATRHLQKHDLTGLPDSLTLLFEIIYPDNRIVVDYEGTEALVLIGARDCFTGEDYRYSTLLQLGAKFGFDVPHHYPFDSPAEAVADTQQLTANVEGYVLRFADGSRFKVKGEQYLLAHRLMTGVSFKRVLEAVSTGAYPALVDGMPDEFLGTIKGYKARIDLAASDIQSRVRTAMQDAPRGDRKTFALWVKDNHQSDQSYMFAAFDNRDLLPLIYKTAFNREVALEEDTNAIRA